MGFCDRLSVSFTSYPLHKRWTICSMAFILHAHVRHVLPLPMSSLSPIRLVTLLLAAVLLLLLLIAGILLTDTLLNIRQNLQQAPGWVTILVLSAFGLFILFAGWLMLHLLRPKKAEKSSAKPPQPVDEATLLEKLQQGKASGLDTSDAEQELARLNQRREAGEVHIALFGEISSGKSSLIKALLPDQEVAISVSGGTTQAIDPYHWVSPAGDRLIVNDMPGLNETGQQQQLLAQQEAMRAHLVIYLCDGDLTRSQAAELERLDALKKPIILALNKTDRLSSQELQQLSSRLQQKAETLTSAELVTISTGATQQAIRILADGTEQPFDRLLEPQLESLKKAIQRAIDGNSDALETLRDSAVFSLISSQLDQAQAAQRDQQAQELVQRYAKKAVVAAVAAITPGTDILIQGYLATQMIKELTALYQVPVTKVDTDLLLTLVQQHVRTHITLLLAVAGNALKAFPGSGTLAGGVLHAIAYGFLFDALGKSLAKSLQTRGELHPLQVASQFEDKLGENIKASAGHYARLAFQQLRHKE